MRDPDIHTKHLTFDRAFEELSEIRELTFNVGSQTITAINPRNALQTRILQALQVDTRSWNRPTLSS